MSQIKDLQARKSQKSHRFTFSETAARTRSCRHQRARPRGPRRMRPLALGRSSFEARARHARLRMTIEAGASSRLTPTARHLHRHARASSRASTSCRRATSKTWMAGTAPGH